MPKSVNREKEKRIKANYKVGGENEVVKITIQEVVSNGVMNASEHVRVSEKEDVAEMRRHRKRDKEKKKSMGTEEADEKKGAVVERQLIGANGEEGSGSVTNNAERKRKNREKKKNDGFEIGSSEEVGKEVENVRTHDENCEINVMEMGERKERKREKEKRKDDNIGVGWQDNSYEAKPECRTDDVSTTNKTVDNENDSKKLFSKKHKDIAENAHKKKKKRARKETDEGDLSSLQHESVPEKLQGNIQSTKRDGNALKKLRKKKHEKEKYSKDDSSILEQDISMQDSEDNGGLLHIDEMTNNKMKSTIKGKRKKTKIVETSPDVVGDNEVQHSKKGKKKKIKPVENDSKEVRENELRRSKKWEKKRTKLVEDGSNDATTNKSKKKVRFSDEVEVFPQPGDSNTEKQGNDGEDNLVRGKRYTPEEDENVKESVLKYIEEHELGDEGLDMVLNSQMYPELKGCWKEIGSAIPHRPYRATYFRAQKLFRGGEIGSWTKEEYERILKYHDEHGNKWRALADELGKHPIHVRNAWSRVKLQNLKKGRWSQEEYQKLFDLVNSDLQSRVFKEKKSNHGMLRDNISWTAISDKLSTRTQPKCCNKWYLQLTSPMVADGVWADSDDYRMLGALYSLDATCMEDVDWDELIEERSGDVCRKRWNQMLLHIGNCRDKSFSEQVEVLAQRYCPHLLEARETWDSKPRVP